MSKCFEPWPSVSSEARILDWLACEPTTIAHPPTSLPTPTPVHTSLGRTRPMAPTTPPATMDEEHLAKRRRLVDHDDQERQEDPPHALTKDQQATSRQSVRSMSNKLPLRPTPSSPTRYRPRVRAHRSAAVKTTLDLQNLQVPVSVRGLEDVQDAKDKLPADILPLYKSIRSVAIHRKAFIPDEVRLQIEASYGDDAQAHWFRPRDASAAAAADADFQALRTLLAAADKSKSLSRNEDAWDAEVHLPLLKLAVSAQPGLDEHEKGHAPNTRLPEVAVELVTSATITADVIPRLDVLQNKVELGAEEDSVLACSISQSGASNTTSGSASAGQHSKTGSKKVDIVLVLVPPSSSPLHHIIAHQFGSVNQSIYGPLLRNPIACSIETKTSTARTDPLVQLGIWTVAWYRRMDALWRSIHSEDTSRRPAVVSLPLITIVDHEWNVYYAVDGGDHVVRQDHLKPPAQTELGTNVRPRQSTDQSTWARRVSSTPSTCSAPR